MIFNHGLKIAMRTISEFGQPVCEETSGDLDVEIARLKELASGEEGGCTWTSTLVDSEDWDAVLEMSKTTLLLSKHKEIWILI